LVAVVLAACSHDGSIDADGLLPRDTGPASLEDTVSASPDTEEDGFAACVPEAEACERGVVARCRADGAGWVYSACPPGQVCRGSGCVDNVPSVVLVVESPIWDQAGGSEGALPEELRAVIEQTLCDELPWCCGAFVQAFDRIGHFSAQVATKYWVRRLLQDLASRGRFSVTLLGAPSRPEPGLAICEPSTLDACLAGAPEGMRYGEWRDALSIFGEVVSGGAHSGIYRPEILWDDELAALTRASVRAMDAEAQVLLTWVDGQFTQSEDGDVTNPELNVAQVIPYNMQFVTWLYLATLHRPEGRPCQSDTDCGHQHYECVEGLCADPAAACRTQDVVLVGNLLQELRRPLWSYPDACDVGGVGGVDWDVWTRWVGWGAACEEERECPTGSTCTDPCTYFQTSECEQPATCLPDAILPYFGTDPIVAAATIDLTRWSPTPFLQDAAGRPVTATTHTVFTGVDPLNPHQPFWAYGGWELAQRAATVGGGVAVAPCIPAILPFITFWAGDSPFISCDYETRYGALVDVLSGRIGTTVCTPERVGLGAEWP